MAVRETEAHAQAEVIPAGRRAGRHVRVEPACLSGNLPYSASASDVETLLKEAGTVASVSLVTDRGTGQSKGFAFVEMGSKEEAEAAIKRFDSQTHLGRVLKVNEARPQERRGGGGTATFLAGPRFSDNDPAPYPPPASAARL